MSRTTFTRRTALKLAGAAAALPALPAGIAVAQNRRHGVSIFGDLKYPADFARFEYVNPDAPKGGRLVTQSPTRAYNQSFDTFNTLHIYVLRGDGAMGMPLTFASLMAGSADEPGSAYAYVASEVEISEDELVYRFFLRPEAVFHDGTQITANDVKFSLDILKAEGHPNIASVLGDMEDVVVEDERTVVVHFAPGRARSLPLTVVGQPIFSADWWEGRDFQGTQSTAPLGSGPYSVARFRFGSFIEFERVADYWADDLPVMVGRYNFSAVRYDYYRDRVAAFEAFKKGDITFREEFTSRIWARDYDFPAITDGRVLRDEVPDGTPSGAQGWFLNTRRAKFSDPTIRKALGYAFDFEWTNANIMFNSYERTTSYFENSPLKAEGVPGPAELALLEPFRDRLSPEVFGEAVVPPVSDGSGRDRELLRQASEMLAEAGCTVEGNQLRLPDGQPFTIEFLMDQAGAATFEPHHNAYFNALRLLGVRPTFRAVDAAQYNERLKNFDFDASVSRFSMPLYPSEGIYQLFGTRSRDQEGSNNMAGIGDEVIDALIDEVVHAEDWDQFTTAGRALDRVLRAGYYWVPHWYKATHWFAYWDIFDRPAIKPPYSRAVLDTWWWDEDKAVRIGMAG